MERRTILLYNPGATFRTMPLALLPLGSSMDASRHDLRIIDRRPERDPRRRGCRLPEGSSKWADFDFVDGATGPWVSHGLMERFRFYNRPAWETHPWWRHPLQRHARWRCDRDDHRMPVEKKTSSR